MRNFVAGTGFRPQMLPEICDSDSLFAMTDFEGVLSHPVPIHGVLGDSHAALFGHGCRQPGQMKIDLRHRIFNHDEYRREAGMER